MDLTMEDAIKVLGLFIFIFILIFLLAVATPKLAKFCDKFIDKVFKKNDSKLDENIYKVKSIYDMPVKKNLEENKNLDGEEKNG